MSQRNVTLYNRAVSSVSGKQGLMVNGGFLNTGVSPSTTPAAPQKPERPLRRWFSEETNMKLLRNGFERKPLIFSGSGVDF